MNPSEGSISSKVVTTDEDTNDSSRYFECSVCFKTYGRLYHLERHYLSHMEERPFTCSKCGVNFKRKDKLQRHQKRFPFDYCSRRRRKGGPEVDPKDLLRHHCPHCDYATARRSSLALHITKHSNERPYSCETCGKKFKTNSVLHRHKETHVVNAVCDVCGKVLRKKSSLREHKRLHHRENRSRQSLKEAVKLEPL